jgi:Tfp pilus assembly protein FimT
MKAIKIDKYSGFTLVELLLIIALILIISLTSVSFYSRFIIQSAVLDTQDQLAESLQKAQIYSMTGKQNTPWGVNYSLNAITLFQGSDYYTRNIAFDEKFNINSNITVSGISQIYFNRLIGTPSTTALISINGNNISKTINVNAQGAINKN